MLLRKQTQSRKESMSQSNNPAAPAVAAPAANEEITGMTALWTVTVKSADGRKLMTFQYKQDDLQLLPPLGLIFQGPEWKDAQGHVINSLRLHVQQLVQTWGAPVVFISLIPASPTVSMGPTDPIPYINAQYEQQFQAALAAMGFLKVREVALAAG